METAARPRLLRLTQARIGDTLHDGNGTVVAIVNAFTTVNAKTDATVRAVDYRIVDASPDQFRMYSDDENDIGRWKRVGVPESPCSRMRRPTAGSREYMPTAETTAPTAPQSKPPIDARIVAYGVRPRRYKKPPDLAHEAGATGDTPPQLKSHTLESNGRHYNGRSYAGLGSRRGRTGVRSRDHPDAHADERSVASSMHAGRQAMMRSRRTPIVTDELRTAAHGRKERR